MMVSFTTTGLTALLSLITLTSAQTSTSCNPTNSTCPSDQGLSSKTFSTDFTKGQNSSWDAAAYTTLTYSDLGAAFTINTKNDAPTISTDFYVFFGYIEVKARAASGTGIVSSIVLQSDDLDEVDWEFLGGDPSAVQTNFFGKGNTTSYDRMVSVPVTAATTTTHTYALNWTSSSLTWLIDGTVVRTLQYNDALALNGKNYPQTPCKLKLGAWAGGASSNEGTVAWAGGKTDFSNAPFTMYVESVNIVNYNPAKSYSYSDKSGDWTSIKIDNATVAGSNSTSSSSSTASSTTKTSSYSNTTSKINSSYSTKSNLTTIGVAAATSTAVSTFIQGSSNAMRRTDSSILDNKIAFLVIFVLGLFAA